MSTTSLRVSEAALMSSLHVLHRPTDRIGVSWGGEYNNLFVVLPQAVAQSATSPSLSGSQDH